MDRYKNYTLREYLQDDEFIRWVKQPDDSGNHFWEGVQREYPFQKKNIDRAIPIIHGLASYYPEVPEAAIETTRQAIFQQYQGAVKPHPGRKLYFLLPVAATILLSLGLFLWNSLPQQAPEHWIGMKPKESSFKNNTESYRAIRLPDSSTVALSPGSQIWYKMDQPNRRQVQLEGVAFFKVTKNADAPFYVLCNGLITKVIGTRFKVSSKPEGVKVEVSSGKVQVYRAEEPESKGLLLTPNQSAEYITKNIQITRSVVTKPRVLVSPEKLKTYTYVDTPISQVFEGLEEIYGINVVYDKEKFKDCKLNMVLSDESLFEKLELIGKMVEARYNVIDGQVIILGDGCRE